MNLRLLQLGDSALPIGGYSHSWGLEAAIDRGLVHSPQTLENWVRRLEANRAAAIDRTDEVTYRIYRIYMAGATMGFRNGVYNLNQCLLVKPHADGSSGLPLTRADWYEGNIGQD